MRLPRFRVRTLMVAVAVAGAAIPVATETVRLRRLSRDYRRKATECAQAELALRGAAATFAKSSATATLEAESLRRGRVPDHVSAQVRSLAADPWGLSRQVERDLLRQLADAADAEARTDRKLAADATREAAHYARLRQRYDQAARRPWVKLPRDPISPESDESLAIRGLLNRPGSKDLLLEWPNPPLNLDLPLKSRPAKSTGALNPGRP